MTALTDPLGAALIHFIWQGALVGAAHAAALVVLRRASARTRYAMSCAALAILAVAPIVTVIGLASLPAAHAASEGPLAAVPPRTVVGIPEAMLPIWIEPAAPQFQWLAQVQVWALPVWAAGVLLLSVRLAMAGLHVVAIGRRGGPVDPDIATLTTRCAERLHVIRPIRVVTSAATDVPSVIGWLRPVVLLPPAAILGLTPAQLEAVIAHEIAHVARHDYVVNVLQTIVETMFFYHPVVWWISNRIRTERELCCDDLAVRSCGDAIGYARALTTLEKLRAHATPALALGSTDGPLLYRIRRLIDAPVQEQAPARSTAILAVCLGLACVALNLNWTQLIAQSETTSLKFEVTSVKPSASEPGHVSINQRGQQYIATGVTLKRLIAIAYQVQDDQTFGGPKWIDETRFDIMGKSEDPTVSSAPPAPGSVTPRQLMLRSLLADRFKLAVHTEIRQLPVYAMVLARKDGALGPRLQSVAPCVGGRPAPSTAAGPSAPGLTTPICGTSMAPGTILGGAISMPTLAMLLSRLTTTGMSLYRPIVDRTGLNGAFNVELHFMPDALPNFGPDGPPSGLIDPNQPSLFSAVQEQLGLKLEATKGPVDVLVIDRADPPTPD